MRKRELLGHAWEKEPAMNFRWEGGGKKRSFRSLLRVLKLTYVRNRRTRTVRCSGWLTVEDYELDHHLKHDIENFGSARLKVVPLRFLRREKSVKSKLHTRILPF